MNSGRALTDGHLDVDSAREGAVLIAPVKVEGGDVYAGDAHATGEGDSEVAGHATDIPVEATVRVEVVKSLRLSGPLLLRLRKIFRY